MTEEQITAIAREYAEEIHTDTSAPFKDDVVCEEIENTESFLRFILQRYCLVEKSKLQSIIEALNEMVHYYNRQAKSCCNNQMREVSEKCAAVMQGKVELLESLFPEIAKEVEG